MNKAHYILILISIIGVNLYAQIDKFQYKRKVSDIEGMWHRIELPDDIYGYLRHDLSDIRIYGITSNGDTIEAPYILKVNTPKYSYEEVKFNTLNISHNKKGYYYTFEVDENMPVNKIDLDFERDNFDWNVKLEGSHHQKEWYTILENYRIASIKNDLTDYSFTKLSFAKQKYSFYRLFIPALNNPKLNEAKLVKSVIEDAAWKEFKFDKINVYQNDKQNRTELIGEFAHPVRVSKLKFEVNDSIDYYRPFTIAYLTDSIKTEVNWVYNYANLGRGTINSLEKNEFKFGSTSLKRLKVLIKNNDNEPLDIKSIKAFGYKHELIVRFTKPANYYLCYGNSIARKPNYDIAKFKKRIPEAITVVQLGAEEQVIFSKEKSVTTLFNKYWLWAVMLVIIALLLWFSVKMMSSKKE